MGLADAHRLTCSPPLALGLHARTHARTHFASTATRVPFTVSFGEPVRRGPPTSAGCPFTA
jgi:hypothetical protein